MHRPPPDMPKERYIARERTTRPKQAEPPHLIAERQAERTRAELRQAIELGLQRESSTLANCFRTHEQQEARDSRDLQAVLSSIEPKRRNEIRQQIIGEIWAVGVFDRGSLRMVSGGRTQRWEELDASERHMVAQKAECLRAAIEDRKPVTLVAFWGADNDRFRCSKDLRNMRIELNYDKSLKSQSIERAVRLIAHEGQHAFDQLAMASPELAPHYSPKQIAALRRNADNYIPPQPNIIGMLLYQAQPIEQMAFDAEDRICSAFCALREREDG